MLEKKYIDVIKNVALNTNQVTEEFVKEIVTNLFKVVLKTKVPKYIVLCDNPYDCYNKSNKCADEKDYNNILKTNVVEFYNNIVRKMQQKEIPLYNKNEILEFNKDIDEFNTNINKIYNLYINLQEVFSNGYRNVFNNFFSLKNNSITFLYMYYFINKYELDLTDDERKIFEILFSTLQLGPIYLHNNEICFVSQNPKCIEVNDDFLLHSLDKPALEYRNKKFYYYGGEQVDKKIIDAIRENDIKWLLLNVKNDKILNHEFISKYLKEI